MKFKPWQETLSSSRSLFKVLPSFFLSPPGPKWLLLSGCGTVKMQHQVHFVLQAVFPTVHANCFSGGARKLQAPVPRDRSPKGRATTTAAPSHKETCVAISVQFKDLPKTLFGCCHSFFWTFTYNIQNTNNSINNNENHRWQHLEDLNEGDMVGKGFSVFWMGRVTLLEFHCLKLLRLITWEVRANLLRKT